MPTLRLIKPRDPVTPAPSGRPGDTRIKLESLPTPLRAIVRDRSEGCITIEAELPWLSIGTILHADCDDGREHIGHVQSFDVEVTPKGSARLLIFASLSPTASLPAAIPRPRTATRPRWWPFLAVTVLALAGAGGYAAARFGPGWVKTPAPAVTAGARPDPTW